MTAMVDLTTRLRIPRAALVNNPVHASWLLSIGLKTVLVIVAWKYRLFRYFLLFCVVGSLAAFSAERWFTPLNVYIWSTKAIALCVWNAVLVSDACNRINAKLNAGRSLLCACTAMLCYAAFAREPRWPESHLEAIFAVTGLVSLFLGLILVLALGRCRADFWWRYSAILMGYMLFDSLTLFPASQYIKKIGVGVGIWTSACYAGWITNCLLNRLPVNKPRHIVRGASRCVTRAADSAENRR